MKHMSTMGLIGGMSWESTAQYYRFINQMVAERLGGFHSARMLLYSVDFDDMQRMTHEERWDDVAQLLGDAGRRLARAGADFLLVCCNTGHYVAQAVEQAAGLPLLHIADVAGDAVRARSLRKVGLLGTRFVMEKDFYAGRIQRRSGAEVVIPDDADRETVHRVIYDELCMGRVLPASRQKHVETIARLADRGCEGVILGCTELPMLIRPQDVDVPLFDTTRLHAEAAVARALGEAGA